MSGISPRHITSSLLDQNQRIAVFLSTLFAVASLFPVIEPAVFRFPSLVVFLILSFVPRHIWNAATRFTLFVVFGLAIFFVAGGFSDEVGTVILVATMMIKYVEMKTHRDASMMALFNLIAPFIAFLQDQTPIILFFAFLSFISTVSLAQILNKKNSPSLFLTLQKSFLMFGKTSLKIIPIALLIYAFLPRVDSPFWGSYMKRSTTGMSEEMNVAQWGEVFEDYSTAFRVRFEGKAPPIKDLYFRGLTLWTFDGKKWVTKPSVPGTVTPSVVPRADTKGTLYKYTVSYEEKGRRFYVIDYPTLTPQEARRMSDDVFVTNGRKVSGQSTWTSGEQLSVNLNPSERTSALQLPTQNPRIKAWSINERKKFKNDLEFAKYVERYLRSEFTYTLDAPFVGENAVDDFFFDNKKGFCVHFSSAFTVIMRSAGVPSRVVNGYVASEISELGDYYRVRQADAHAWAEIWVDEKWVRFDPTSSVGALGTTQGFRFSFLNGSYATIDWMKDGWDRYVLYYDKAAQEQTVNSIKNAFTLDGFKKLIKSFQRNSWVLYGGLVVVFVSAVLIRRRRLKIPPANKVALLYHNWLCGQGMPSEAISLMTRTNMVMQTKNSEKKQEIESISLILLDYLYNPKTVISSRTAMRTARKLKKID